MMSYELSIRGLGRLKIGGLLWVLLFCQACGNVSGPAVGKAEEPGLPDADGLAVIAVIDGAGITVREFRQEMDYHRAGIFSYFNRKYATDSVRDFWNHSFEGETPLEVLKEKALDAACRHKLQQILMKEKGLAEDVSYEAFLRRWKKENQARREAVEQGKVIYGPVEYTERSYFRYLLTNQVIRLKEDLAGQELSFTEDDLKRYFKEIKETRYGRKAGNFENHRQDVRTGYLDSLYNDYIEKRLAESTIKINDEVYKNYE